MAGVAFSLECGDQGLLRYRRTRLSARPGLPASPRTGAGPAQ